MEEGNSNLLREDTRRRARKLRSYARIGGRSFNRLSDRSPGLGDGHKESAGGSVVESQAAQLGLYLELFSLP